MNKYLKNLNRIEFVVTRACTGKCKHCSEGEYSVGAKETTLSSDTIDYGENIDKDIAVQVINIISERYNIESVMTFGGEPLLYPDTVCKIHSAATEINIPKRQLITNGYFSKDIKIIQSVADKIVESGVNDILLSVDAFHQETIPLEYVKVFVDTIKTKGVRLRTNPAWLVSCDADNPYNKITREIINGFKLMDIEENEGNVIFPSGNALIYLKEYFDSCEEGRNPYWEDPEDVHTICVSANGDVLHGNLYKHDICEIFSSYNPKGMDISL